MSAIDNPEGLIYPGMFDVLEQPRAGSAPELLASRWHYLRGKRYFDRLTALGLLIPALPAIGLLMLLVWLSDRGPGLFRQIRVGKGRRPFLMYKIRTMRLDAERGTGPLWAALNDNRLTRVGRVIRRLHLDELPQLFNVLKGEMSLVGPRPERPEFVAVLAREIPGYLDRLAVLPGITGLAQVNLPPDTDLGSVERKLALDLQYIRQGNAWLDARLVLCTAARVVRLPLVRVLGLHREAPLRPRPTPELEPGDEDSVSPASVARMAAERKGRHADRHAPPSAAEGFAAPRKPR
jgi:lipopolysaccharide/colanic/teichoic acid biosynthesis glycosyltransferase